MMPLELIGAMCLPNVVGGLLGGLLRKAENKAKAQHSWGLGLAELGNKKSDYLFTHI